VANLDCLLSSYVDNTAVSCRHRNYLTVRYTAKLVTVIQNYHAFIRQIPQRIRSINSVIPVAVTTKMQTVLAALTAVELFPNSG
jgi:hypothetical protein